MTWQADLAHSSLTVSAKHMMVTTVRGTLAIKSADVEFDPGHPEQATVRAIVDPASIDTRNEQRDAHLRSADFLDTDRCPEIVFRSTGVELTGANRGRAHGELTLRGVTRPVTLEVEYHIVRDMRGGRRGAFNAHTKVNRQDFGLTWNVALEQGGWLVSKELDVDIDLAIVESAEEADAQAKAETELSTDEARRLTA